MNAPPSLYSILTRARPTWSNDDLCRVHEKLQKAGITDLGSLSRAISNGSLNNALAALGEKKLKSSTVQQLKLVVRQLRQKQEEEPLHPLILRRCYCDKCLVEIGNGSDPVGGAPSRSSCCEMLNSPSKPVTPQQKPGFNGKPAVLPRLLAGKSKSEAALPKDRTLLPQILVPAKPRLVPLSSANKEPVSHGLEVPTLRLRPLGSVLKSPADSAQCEQVEDLSRMSSKEAPNSSATLSCASWVGDFPEEKPLPAKVVSVPPREPILSSFGQQAQDWKFGPRLLPALEKERLRMASEAVVLVRYVGATMKRDPLVPEGFQVKARQEAGGHGALRADDLPINDAARARLHRARLIHAYS